MNEFLFGRMVCCKKRDVAQPGPYICWEKGEKILDSGEKQKRMIA